MRFRKWEALPDFMKTEEVRVYYDILNKKRGSLALKRALDILMAFVLLLVLLIPMLIIAILIKVDSKGPVLFRQERITCYGKKFRIHKFRTMVSNAGEFGTALTVDEDRRITKIGKKLRDLRLDELPQLIDVLKGDMAFVGTRPESPKYVEAYSSEMYATLLLPAGITSEASIRYKDEAKLLSNVEDVDRTYIEEILPEKMKYNLQSIRRFSVLDELGIMIRTVGAVLK